MAYFLHRVKEKYSYAKMKKEEKENKEIYEQATAQNAATEPQEAE